MARRSASTGTRRGGTETFRPFGIEYRERGMIGTMQSATERRKHLAEIEQIIARWQAGEITMTVKRQLIADSNHWFYGQARNSRRTGASLTSVGVETELSHRPAHPADDPEREAWFLR